MASQLEWALDNSLLCCKQTDTCHMLSVAWPHIPCVLKRSHSRGILIFALGYRHHTQETYGYLPWDCCLIRTSIHCSHSRGILILVGTCCISTALSSPHSRSNAVRCVEAPLFYLCHCYNSGLKPTGAHLRDNTVYCRGPLTLIPCVEYIINIYSVCDKL